MKTHILPLVLCLTTALTFSGCSRPLTPIAAPLDAAAEISESQTGGSQTRKSEEPAPAAETAPANNSGENTGHAQADIEAYIEEDANFELDETGQGHESDAETIVGKWEAALNMADILNESITGDPEAAQYIHIDRFPILMDLSFGPDGTMTFGFNRDSFISALQGIRTPLKEGIIAYLENQLEGTGVSVKEAMESNGVDLEAMLDQITDPEAVPVLIGCDASENGYYRIGDGKLYFMDEYQTKQDARSTPIPYALSDDSLTLYKPAGADLGEMDAFFPLEFVRK